MNKVFAIDISGATSTDQVKDYLRKNAAVEDKIIFFDTRVKETTLRDALIESWPTGSGTVIETVTKWRDENSPTAHLIIMSDGYFTISDNVSNVSRVRVDNSIVYGINGVEEEI